MSDLQIQPAKEKNITDEVLMKVSQLSENKLLHLPEDYSAANALKSAFLCLQEVKTTDKKQALLVCTKNSIANALLDMVVQGLNPMKKQCYFIAYNDKLLLQRSYMGSIAVAKRHGGLKSIRANVIYANDVFVYEINKDTGLTTVIKHEQKLTNIDLTKIIGAYATLTMQDGSTDVVVMNMQQIKNSWNMGAAKGGSPAHTGFADEMAKKTVISRACKLLINASDDAPLLVGNDEDIPDNLSNNNTQDVSFEDVIPTEEPEELQEEIAVSSSVENKGTNQIKF